MKIGLTSNGPLTGKTTFARYLQEHQGFILASHTMTLMESFVAFQNAVRDEQITVEDVLREKETYREALQDYGFNVGFNDPGLAAYWIDRTVMLSGWTPESGKSIVFDSFRGEIQAHYARNTGWVIVQLVIPEPLREARAMSMGKRYADIKAAMDKEPALEKGISSPDVILVADQQPSMMFAKLQEALRYVK